MEGDFSVCPTGGFSPAAVHNFADIDFFDVGLQELQVQAKFDLF